jgi:uncharacterized membrane protein
VVNRNLRRVARIFLTGLLAALPLMATVLILVWTGQLLFQWFGPESLIGSGLVAIGFGLGGTQALGYLIGLGLLTAAIFGLGILVESGLERGLATAVNAVVSRIPLVRHVYDVIEKFVGMVSQRDKEGLKSMSAVWCHFGGPGGAAVLALLSSPEPVLVEGKPFLAVVLPTTPVPVGGGLVYVPEHWVTPASLGMEAVTSIYVSMGVTSPQHLPAAPRSVAADVKGATAPS